MIWADGKRRLFVDIESYSSVDIKAAGAVRYIQDPSFEILLIQYAFDDDPVRVLDCSEIDFEERDPLEIDTDLAVLIDALKDPSVVKVAHNCIFERTALGKFCGAYLPPEQWHDTMVMAAYNGLPLSLDASGAALGIQQQKMKEGKACINYFCKPCKPTKANGGRTRNLPEHNPEKWEVFKQYGGRDVEAMREIYHRLIGYPVTDFERSVFCMDARVNERGVMIDRELASAAVDMDERYKAARFAEMQKLTGLENPGSVQQLSGWLADNGVRVTSLGKAVVAELLETVTSPTVRRVLELRQLLGKTSTKKYVTMLTAAGDGDRVRGITQYYGAGRSGRWSGRLLQCQNFPQNHLDAIDQVRELARTGDLETFELCYPNVTDTLSQLLRTALIAKPGHTFLVADYSAIEARVTAYLAGCKWRMDVFKNGGDIYCSSATAMFHVPVVKHGINGHLRQKGKVAELACIAEGSPVLTDKGLVPIQDVTPDMMVWDGSEWVIHDGVVYKGEKEVITYEGLTATPDHLVWVEGEQRPVHFGIAASRGAHLAKTGDGWYPVRLGGDHQPREEMEPEVESLLCADQVYKLWSRPVARSGKLTHREIKRLPELLRAPETVSLVVRPPVHRCEAKVYESARRELQKLRGPWYQVQVPFGSGSVFVYGGDERITRQGTGDRPHRRERPLRAWKSTLGNTSAKLPESAPVSRKVRVYDILNAGPRHRFTVSGVLVHNCGYGGGVNALKAFGADKMGLSEEEMQEIVTHWRAASPEIPRFWSELEKAARYALQNPGRRAKIKCGVTYLRDKDGLRCQLPSGRWLTYWDARLDDDGHITYMGQSGTAGIWQRLETWGGKLVENVVQAFARDCLAVAMVRLEKAGYNICFHVHDEVIAEQPDGSRWEDMAEIMGQSIDWAPGLTLNADGYSTKFYMKD